MYFANIFYQKYIIVILVSAEDTDQVKPNTVAGLASRPFSPMLLRWWVVMVVVVVVVVVVVEVSEPGRNTCTLSPGLMGS